MLDDEESVTDEASPLNPRNDADIQEEITEQELMAFSELNDATTPQVEPGEATEVGRNIGEAYRQEGLMKTVPVTPQQRKIPQ